MRIWYRIDVPVDANRLAISLVGDPDVRVGHELFGDDGSEIPLEVIHNSGTVSLTAEVEPGTYTLRISEPRRSVVFAWDTSGSVSSYLDVTYQSLAEFARAVDPELEVVNLLPFSDEDPPPLLLEEWGDEPAELMAALTNYDRQDGSSNAEANLLAAVNALGARQGTRAITLMTDAESGGYKFSQELWTAMTDVRPRIFTFEISSAGSENTQDLMQDWADVNNGFYDYMSSIGELQNGFDRAACLLRRPTRYQVSVAFDQVELPTPTPEPTATATPTATPSPIPTATMTATPEPTATPSPLPTSTATGTATETSTWTPTPLPTMTPTAIPSETPTATFTPEPTATATPSQPAALSVVAPAAAEPVIGSGAIELILDASGSMLQQLDGRRRIDIAKETLLDLSQNILRPGTPVALRVFGHIEPDTCLQALEVPLQPLDPAVISLTIAGIEARNLARTPIAESLRLVAEDLAGVSGPKVVVLVTDGEETCDGDPPAAIRALREQGVDVRVNIVGFAIDDVGLRAQFEEWASIGGGRYFSADSAEELGTAVQEALIASFSVLDAQGNVVAAGTVNDGPVLLPAGDYVVEILTEPLRRYEVALEGGQSVVLQTE